MDKRNNLVVLSLGGNVGDVKNTLSKVVKSLEDKLGQLDEESSLYQTVAWGEELQPDFLNQVISIKTTISPKDVLKICLDTELELGRDRINGEKWKERVIDIDVLFYEDKIIESRDFTLPHPYIQDRNFVLFPLEEILPKFSHPVLNKTIEELKNSCKDNLQITKLLD